jgi:hypothetical protein
VIRDGIRTAPISPKTKRRKVMFNALKYTEELEKAGFTREQAEVSMKLLVETMNENFATKADFKELKWDTSSPLNWVL